MGAIINLITTVITKVEYFLHMGCSLNAIYFGTQWWYFGVRIDFRDNLVVKSNLAASFHR
jgi:hypothetical protein